MVRETTIIHWWEIAFWVILSILVLTEIWRGW
jgi:hypothetical protein